MRIPLTASVWERQLRDAYYRLDDSLRVLEESLEGSKLAPELRSQFRRRFQNTRESLSAFDDAESESTVRWTQRAARSVSIGTSPVHVGKILAEHLFTAIPAVVLTSATLTTKGKFDFIRDRLGLSENTESFSLESAFDFATQAALYVPQDLPDPRDEAYFESALEEIVRLIALTDGGTFLLCTSLRMMEQFATVLRKRVSQTILVQGEAPKSDLIEAFQQSEHAVLIATSTFWEGVNVPGFALRSVIIDKLPFEVPSDPLVRARCDELERRGESAFIRYLVPSAALTLKQGVGRLIRTTSDYGIVAVLDSRLKNKGYGKTILQSLPDAARCDTFENLAQFYGEANLRSG
ncbi:MAG: helicase C-terminal domain-containing protein [Polyangiales bacterium]